jgi:glycosyltransferase involved in cell wall biosynthesis
MAAANEILLSVVVTVYRAESTLPELCDRLNRTLLGLTDDFEIILVDDRSPDASWDVILGLLPLYPRLVAARLSRNFGQHYAITAGLDLARGRWTVVMDCDLQDQPEYIGLLLKKAQEGFDIVLARRVSRQDTFTKRVASAAFHKVFTLLSGYRLDRSVGAFRIMERRVVDGFCRMRETYRSFGGMVGWLGFSTTYVDTQHGARHQGRSSYTWRAEVRLALDSIISFSNRPLYLSALVGATMSTIASASVVFLVMYFVIAGRPSVPGWLSLLAVTTFIGGLILFNLGVIGIYLGRLYDQVKQRPLYMVDCLVVGSDMASRTGDRPGIGNPGLESKGNSQPDVVGARLHRE